MSKKIFIFDTTLRDGEQSPGASMNTEEKLEIAEQLIRLNVDIIEAGFAASSEGDFLSVQKIARLAKARKGPQIACLARCVENDIVGAAEALEPAIQVGKGVIHVFLGTSPIQLGVLRKTADQALKLAVQSIRLAKGYCPEVEFSAMDATRTDIKFLLEVTQAAIEIGATIINIPDSVGCTFPRQFGALITAIREKVPENIRLSIHCHDDLGLASANALEAILCGADQVECAVNSLGERAGNTSLEQILAIIKVLSSLGIYTEVNTVEMLKTSHLVDKIISFGVPPNTPVIGSNAFAHSSGVHQDAMRKDRTSFEILIPGDWGVRETKLVLGPRSSRKVLQDHLLELGYELSDEDLALVFTEFKRQADKIQGEMGEFELRAIVQSALNKMLVEEVSVVNDGGIFQARLVVKVGKKQEFWNGTSSVGDFDAVCQAINAYTNTNFTLKKYNVDNIGEGTDALAAAIVVLRENSARGSGTAEDSSTQKASAQAYLNAVLEVQKKLLIKTKGATFNPKMKGKPQKLYTGKRYPLPERPGNGRLLVGVGAGQVAFFWIEAGAWRGGHYQSSRWRYFNTADVATDVSFPQYGLGQTSSDHRYGEPLFWREEEELRNLAVLEETGEQT